jgi:hypothetical protein
MTTTQLGGARSCAILKCRYLAGSGAFQIVGLVARYFASALRSAY